MLAYRNHRQVLDIQIHRHRHQIRITLAFHHLLRPDGLCLREVDGRAGFGEDQLRREGLPLGVSAPPLKIAVVTGRKVD
jgi:hypothetical protein